MHANEQAHKADSTSAKAPPSTSWLPTGLLALQASAGNAAVMQMLRQAGHPWAQPEQATLKETVCKSGYTAVRAASPPMGARLLPVRIDLARSAVCRRFFMSMSVSLYLRRTGLGAAVTKALPEQVQAAAGEVAAALLLSGCSSGARP